MFVDYDIDGNLRNFIVNIQKEVESDRKVLDSSEEEYLTNKINQYKIDLLSLHPDQITVSQKEYPIPVEYFPSGFLVDRGRSYNKPVLTFHLPFEGNPQWLRSKPSTFMYWTEEVSVANGEIIFEIINFSNNADSLKKERDEFLNKLQEQVKNINNNLAAYNSKLESIIREAIKKAKDKFKNQDDLLSQLGNSSRQ